MPVDPMDDIELRSVQLQFSNGRGSLSGNCDLRRVVTDKGEVLVAVQGDTSKPAILTYHDLGLNCMCHPQTLILLNMLIYCVCVCVLPVKLFLNSLFHHGTLQSIIHLSLVSNGGFGTDATSFAGFFNYPTMRALLDNFCVYHVTAPGQEEGAPSLPEEYAI